MTRRSKSKGKKDLAGTTVPGANPINPGSEPAPPGRSAPGVVVISGPVSKVAQAPTAKSLPARADAVAVAQAATAPALAPAQVVAQNPTIIAPVITATSSPLLDTASTSNAASEADSNLSAGTLSPDNTMVSTSTSNDHSVESSIHSSEFDTAIEIVPTVYPFPPPAPPAPAAPVLGRFDLTWPLGVPKALEQCQLFGPGGLGVDCPLLTSLLQIAHLVDIVHSATHPPTLSPISPGSEPMPTLFLDLEGTKLSRYGSISILQICIQRELPAAFPARKNAGRGRGGWSERRRAGTLTSVDELAMKLAKMNYPSQEETERQRREDERSKAAEVYLIDVHTLGASAFTTGGITNPSVTLKSILEDVQVPKVFFDVRNDSNALFFLYNIKLGGIHDLQVMKAATDNNPFILGLGKCIKVVLHIPDLGARRSVEPAIDSALNNGNIRAIDDISRRGKAAFAPELGGSYSVFLERPLAKEMLHYCIADVVLMPATYARLRHDLDTWDKNNTVKAITRQAMRIEVGEYIFNMLNASESRVFVSQLERYDPTSKSKILDPWQTLHNHNKRIDLTPSSRCGRGRGRGRGRGGGRGRGVPGDISQPEPWHFSDGVEWIKFATPVATAE